MRLSQILTGPDRDARLLRTDGNTVGVGVVRFGPLDDELAVVALVERGEPGSTEGRVDRTWAAELERLARVGTWSFDLATGALARSDTLEELYRDVGLDADDPHRGGWSASRPTRCGRRCAAGTPRPDDHVELHLPGDVRAVLPGRDRVDARRHPGARRRRGARRERAPQRQRPALRRPHDRHARRRGRARPGGPDRLGQPRPVRAAGRARRAAARDGGASRWPPSRRWAGFRAGCGRCRPAPSTATGSRPRRCCAPTAPRSGASWT